MAQTNFTPILLYASSTAAAVPSAGNLINSATGSEIAINVADKNLFFKDSTNAVNTVPIRQSSTSSNGWLSSTDWNTFNNKQPAGTYVTSVTGTAPVVSSGGTTPAISMAAATTSVSGYLTSTDWNTFNGKQAALVSGTNIKTVGGVSLLGSGDVGTIGVAYGGTGTSTAFTSGSIVFAGASGVYTQNNANLFWDATNSRLGIGTSSPAAKLQTLVSGTGNYFSGGDSAGGRRLEFRASTTTNTGDTQNLNALGGSGVLAFQTNDIERMRINSSGDVQIGTLTVSGLSSKSISVGYLYGTISTSADGVFQAWNQAASGNNNLITFYTEGGGGTFRGNINYNRTAGLVAYNTTSDYRSKDIIGFVLDSGEVIDSVPVYMGKMKEATQARPMFIAHETPYYAHTGEKDAVDKDGKPVYQQMDTSALVPVLWAEVQSLRKRIATLEEK